MSLPITESPKVTSARQLDDTISYSHKMKTKRIWKDKESPKNIRYNTIPDRLEPSQVIHYYLSDWLS